MGNEIHGINKEKSEEKDGKEERKKGIPPMFVGPSRLSYDRNKVLEVTPNRDFSNFTNFGLFPLPIIHNVFLFCELRDLFSISQSCKLFSSISNTSYFWKKYYEHYFQEKKSMKEEENINWKEEFYRRLFHENSEETYKKRYQFCEVDDNELDLGMIVLMGSGACGKSSLVIRFMRRGYEEDYIPTIEDSYVQRLQYDTVDQEKGVIRISILDTAGQEEYSALWTSAIESSVGLILVLDLDLDDFKTAEELLCLYHKRFNSYESVIVVGNKSDIEEEKRAKKKEKVIQFLTSHKIPQERYIEVSCKENKMVHTAFGMMIDHLIIKKNKKDKR